MARSYGPATLDGHCIADGLLAFYQSAGLCPTAAELSANHPARLNVTQRRARISGTLRVRFGS